LRDRGSEVQWDIGTLGFFAVVVAVFAVVSDVGFSDARRDLTLSLPVLDCFVEGGVGFFGRYFGADFVLFILRKKTRLCPDLFRRDLALTLLIWHSRGAACSDQSGKKN
jgi:hypothetical protein